MKQPVKRSCPQSKRQGFTRKGRESKKGWKMIKLNFFGTCLRRWPLTGMDAPEADKEGILFTRSTASLLWEVPD